jgi:DNA-binding transcriptional LysR family regulator
MDRFSELNAFRAVVASGGFSAAARRLGVATSSVTRLVDSLEQRLGAVLVNRSTRSVTLTDSGRRYFSQAEDILALIAAADDEACGRRDSGELRGVLRVAAPVTFCARHIAPLLPRLARRHPLLEVQLHLSDAVTHLVDDAIDVAVRIGSVEQHPNLIVRKLARHERIVCASPAYLAQHGTPTTPADLAQHNCLLFAYDAVRAPWRLQPRAGGPIDEVAVAGTLVVNNAEVLRSAAIGGMGVVMLASWLIDDAIASGELVALLPHWRANPGPMDVGLLAVYQANRRGSPKIQAFIELLEAAIVPAPPAEAPPGG